MTDRSPPSSTGSRCNSIRSIAANFSLAAFLFAWPFVTAYITAAWFLVDETVTAKGNIVERMYFLGAFMLYAYPLVIMLKVGVSWVAIGMAVLSARLLPVLLAVVTWLSLKGLLPTGIIEWDGKAGWKDAMLYSALTMLVVALSVRLGALRNQLSPINTPPYHPQSPDTCPGKD